LVARNDKSPSGVIASDPKQIRDNCGE